MTDEELAARMRAVGERLRRRLGNLDREAGWLMKEAADRLEGGGGDSPAPLIGYLIDGKLWHPSDVTIVRQGAAQDGGVAE